ncbi:MAG: acyl-CoA dehydrogenase family protein [Chloroflexota bacterium]
MYDFEFSEEQRAFVDLAAKFSREEIAPTALMRDKNSEFPGEILRKMGELGFLGMTVSPDWGGVGMDYVSYVGAMEEISKADSALGIILSVQNSLVDWILESYGSDEQREKYLRPLAEGRKLGAYCLSEPDAGSDARKLRTEAKKVDGGWLLNGMKNWVSSGNNADTYIIFAQSDPSLEHRGICCFVVERGSEGLEPGPPEDKLGMRSSDTCALSLSDVFVPEENLIGERGGGFYIAMKALNGGRIGIASQSLGIAQAALEASVRYARKRVAMGKPISEHQLIQAKIAQMSMRIDAARLLTLKAAWLRDRKQKHIREASHAKLFASATAFDCAREAIQIHGGYGYVREYGVEKLLRDSKVTEIYEGTSEIQQLVIARDVINNDYLEEI